jgi:hypothetical protein
MFISSLRGIDTVAMEVTDIVGLAIVVADGIMTRFLSKVYSHNDEFPEFPCA